MDTKNVSAGKPKIGGAAYCAPLGSALPTSAASALDSAFVELGYFSEDGLTNSNTPEIENVKAWGGDTVLTLQKSKDDVFAFKMIECLNINVLKTVYGSGNVSEKGSNITIKANSEEAEQFAWVFDMRMKGNIPKRVVVPAASVTELGDITYKDDSPIGYDVKITAVPDSDANTHYEYIGSESSEPTS